MARASEFAYIAHKSQLGMRHRANNEQHRKVVRAKRTKSTIKTLMTIVFFGLGS